MTLAGDNPHRLVSRCPSSRYIPRRRAIFGTDYLGSNRPRLYQSPTIMHRFQPVSMPFFQRPFRSIQYQGSAAPAIEHGEEMVRSKYGPEHLKRGGIDPFWFWHAFTAKLSQGGQDRLVHLHPGLRVVVRAEMLPGAVREDHFVDIAVFTALVALRLLAISHVMTHYPPRESGRLPDLCVSCKLQACCSATPDEHVWAYVIDDFVRNG